jgi:hypothetical protein
MGSIRDAATSQVIENVMVIIMRNGVAVDTVYTDVNGSFSDAVTAGSGYSVVFASGSYHGVTYSDITVETGMSNYIETVMFINTSYSGTGNVGGIISSATSGQAISGATLNLREGLHSTSGAIMATMTTDANGQWYDTLTTGYYTLEITQSGYVTAYLSVISLGGLTINNQNTTINPVGTNAAWRIVLTWGEAPSDLDLHMTGPMPSGARFHCYYSNKNPMSDSSAFLDVDDMSSYGPETITMRSQTSGVYRVYIYNYSGGGATVLSQSGARVQVYKNSALTAVFSVPNGSGRLWHVFDLDGNSLSAANTLSDSSASSLPKMRAK